MQDQIEMPNKHIDFLKSLDTEEFYNKDEDEVRSTLTTLFRNLFN